jgi:hypothetical protein
MSAKDAETFARQAMSRNKDTDEKLRLIARAIAELAQTIAQIESNILSMR